MKICLSSCLLILGVLLSPTAAAQLAQLEVTVHGLQPATGTVEVTLFNSAATFLKKPFLQKAAAVEGADELTFRFVGLLDGEYALVVVHDENGNKVLDSGFLGFGSEGIGYSNDAAPWLGRPSFDDARFTIGEEDLAITVNLK